MTNQPGSASFDLAATLAEYGIDHADAMERMMNNEALFKQLAQRYITDTNCEGFIEAMNAGDLERAYKQAHTLKGVAGNLAFTQLYQLAEQACDALTSGNVELATKLMDPIAKADKLVRAGLDHWNGLDA